MNLSDKFTDIFKRKQDKYIATLHIECGAITLHGLPYKDIRHKKIKIPGDCNLSQVFQRIDDISKRIIEKKDPNPETGKTIIYLESLLSPEKEEIQTNYFIEGP